MKKRVRVYLHSSKESMYDKGYEAGLEGEALSMFQYALYEVKVDLEVDAKTGKAWIVGVNGEEVPEGPAA